MRSKSLASELSSVGRVRELRARLASNEALKLRQAYVRTQVVFDDIQRTKVQHEARAAQISEWLSRRTAAADAPSLVAADAHDLMSYVDAARLKAREAAATARRTELARQRAQSAANEASGVWRRALTRHEAIRAAQLRAARAERHRKLEHDDEALAEERAHYETARRAGPWMEPTDECAACD